MKRQLRRQAPKRQATGEGGNGTPGAYLHHGRGRRDGRDGRSAGGLVDAREVVAQAGAGQHLGLVPGGQRGAQTLQLGEQGEVGDAEADGTPTMPRIDRIGERGNIVHDKWTLVDTDVASTLGWALYAAKLDATQYRHLSAWLGRFQERPVVCAHMNQAS